MKHLPNLLIVDDSEENLLFLETVVREINVNVIQALSGSEALNKTKGLELALAIVDVWMPEMNGYDLAVKMNEERPEVKVPIIFLTASNVNEMQVFKGYGSGAVDYIFKPFDQVILLSKINVFLDLFNQKHKVVKSVALLKKYADELTRVNAALKKSEEKYRSYIDYAPDGVFVADEKGRYVEVNEAAGRITGYSKDELLKMSISDILAEESLEEGMTNIRKMDNEGSSKSDLLFKHKNGTKRWWTVDEVKLTESRILGFTKDITERKIAEQALKLSEEKYRTMLNASPDGIFIIDLKGLITDVSVIGLELYGADKSDEMVGKHFFQFVPPEEKKTIMSVIEKTMNEGIAQNVEIKIKRKNQSYFLCETSATLIQDADGTPFSFMIIVRDISQRKKMEKKQIHADRMASLGEMASGIAHEINQPLNTISMVMDNILFEASKREHIEKEYLKKKTDKIFDNITRIRNIIDHVRAFSRSQDDYILTGFDINNSVKDAVTMVSEQFKHLAINMNLQLQENLPMIPGNTFKFEQVILNLLSNAKDALLEKKSKQLTNFNMFVTIRSFLENKRIIIEMSDNGTGISEEDIEYIMLPFYTTKDAGMGTGLGLSISYQILKEMNGSIEIASNSFHGTTFKVILPIQNKQ
ncbi:MAG: PAS domain S-box protein [Bacteroidota bacterium]